MDSKKFYKEKYKIAFNAVKNIINEIDPTGFIGWYGSEAYRAEVSLILAGLIHCENEQDIKKVVIKVFSHYDYFDVKRVDAHPDITSKLMEVKNALTN